MKEGIWITWNSSQRSYNLSKVLNLALYDLEICNSAIVRFIICSILTIFILIRIKPQKVFIQYSFLLLIIVDLYKIIFGEAKINIICDCHTKAIKRDLRGKIGKIFNGIKSYSFRYVDLCIISNNGLVPNIRRYTKYFYILPDKIPDMKSGKRKIKTNYSVFICSFSEDEPIEEVIKASDILNGLTVIKCTGKIPKKYKKFLSEGANNIVFTDFLEYNDYIDLLANADCIIALTEEEACLQCGGYEGLSIGVPIVVSKTTALKKYFLDAAVYVHNEADKIAEGVEFAIANRKKLIKNMTKIRIDRKKQFQEKICKLNQIIQQNEQ